MVRDLHLNPESFVVSKSSNQVFLAMIHPTEVVLVFFLLFSLFNLFQEIKYEHLHLKFILDHIMYQMGMQIFLFKLILMMFLCFTTNMLLSLHDYPMIGLLVDNAYRDHLPIIKLPMLIFVIVIEIKGILQKPKS